MGPLDSYIHRKVVVLHETDSAANAAKAMREHQIGCVVVVNHKGSVSGIVTDRDLLNAVIAEERGAKTSLREIMTQQPSCVLEDANLPAAIELMKAKGVRRIPVVHHTKDNVAKCVGLVSLDDLLAAQAVTPGDLAQIIKAQIYRGTREDSRQSPTVGEFLKVLGAYFYNDVEELEKFSAGVFESLFRRLHYSSAIQFMWQLPKEYQARLSQLAPGPDRTVTARSVVERSSVILHIPQEGVAGAVQKLWMVLNRFGDTEALDATMAQLPEDLQALFSHPSGPMRVSAG